MAPTTNARKRVTASWRDKERTVNTATQVLASVCVLLSQSVEKPTWRAHSSRWENVSDEWAKVGSKIQQMGKIQERGGGKYLSCELQKTHQVNWNMTMKYIVCEAPQYLAPNLNDSWNSENNLWTASLSLTYYQQNYNYTYKTCAVRNCRSVTAAFMAPGETLPLEETDMLASRTFRAGCSHLSHWGLRVQHEVAERSLENPAELCEEASVVGDGPGAGGGGLVSTLDYSFWNTAQASTRSDSTIRFNNQIQSHAEVVHLDAPSSSLVCL